MKRLWTVAAVVIILAAGKGVYAGVTALSGHYLATRSGTVSCDKNKPHKTYEVSISGNAVLPNHTQAYLCDTLRITNTDNVLRLMAFGEHDKHQLYNNISEKALLKGQSLSVTLDKTGTYRFHDHSNDTVNGDFTVL